MVAASCPLDSNTIQSLAVATAVITPDGQILDANSRFVRLFGLGRSHRPVATLGDVVAEGCRSDVEAALREFTAATLDAPRAVAMRPRSALSVVRAAAPPLRIVMEICRQGTADGQYVVSAAPAEDRRQTVERRRCDARHADVALHPSTPRDAAATRAWPPMLRTLSHELRGSLNGIRGWVALAESGALPSDRLPRALGIIRRNVDALWSLVETMFDLSRTGAGCLQLHCEVLDINELVEDVADVLSPAATQRCVTLTVGCADEPLFVNGDRVRLAQIVRNLVDNAIKFTPDGGSVEVRTIGHHACCRLVVTDSGVGIAPDVLPVIFDPIRRGERHPSGPNAGLGIGLALVRDLVHLHHGDITATSTGTDHGSTFVVQLPLAPAPLGTAA